MHGFLESSANIVVQLRLGLDRVGEDEFDAQDQNVKLSDDDCFELGRACVLFGSRDQGLLLTHELVDVIPVIESLSSLRTLHLGLLLPGILSQVYRGGCRLRLRILFQDFNPVRLVDKGLGCGDGC